MLIGFSRNAVHLDVSIADFETFRLLQVHFGNMMTEMKVIKRRAYYSYDLLRDISREVLKGAVSLSCEALNSIRKALENSQIYTISNSLVTCRIHVKIIPRIILRSNL